MRPTDSFYLENITLQGRQCTSAVCVRKMGGVVGTLLYLYCCSGCQASVVASALAFHPPIPQYTMSYDEETKQYTFKLDEGSEDMNKSLPVEVKAHMIRAKRGMNVPVVIVTRAHAKYTILYSHGNATDCGAMFSMYVMMAIHLGVNVVGYDYTGYGASLDSGVRPTEQQTYKDIKAVYNYCIESKLVSDPGTQLLLYGQSVGSGPTCFIAQRYPVAGIILHSPILSGLRVITDSRLLCCFDIFPNINRIRDIRAPLFVIHGKDDGEVTVKHGDGLLRAAPEEYKFEPWWVEHRGHNDVLQNNEQEFIRRMTSFILHVTAFHAPSAVAERAAKKAKQSNNKDIQTIDSKDSLQASNMKVVTA